ncbi:hypothetical protein IC235_14755 [Hymenobacter sp. BT664]|uniref:Uncharacterized protein n=1 Tax=Hymenobacter montanus TaxID=2771359 RepID=A0A927GK65_9BACT|nr:hypothetical protein [Hymenobacter montanus]MBD2769150.1 hypothetical protein [Hymenobacter montanus]
MPNKTSQGWPELEVGMVIRSYVPDTTPPKSKYWVVVGITEDEIGLATVYVNSRINAFLMRNDILLNAQYRLEPNSQQISRHTSYADCSQIKEKGVADIQALLGRNPGYI